MVAKINSASGYTAAISSSKGAEHDDPERDFD